ncbi:TonB-dependent receptor [Solimonas sp. C16B3]|uniref:TonB-dependent receptor n=2 Tax=Solimonas marina TaxID=2714601 RepID=A0A969WBF2_9GAMM|nr:TonB-dependent receptor [Solimonas marina]NKF23877.1 TonB-dependent receptor [Solimonas marina]
MQAFACSSLVLSAALAANTAYADDAKTSPAPTEVAQADVADASDMGMAEVIVTGTRKVGMQASDSPAPVQVVGAETLKQSGAADVSNMISMQVPSFNVNQRGGDMASQTLTANLRNLSANHVLVLVNGKRRHITSNVGASSGEEAADLAFIPQDAIDHVEVLTDGAAAQYGSDAIAGVINIILKKDKSGGSAGVSYAGYKDGGGGTDTWTASAAFGNDKSYFDLSAEVQNQATVTRAQPYGPAVCVSNPTECQAYIDTGGPNSSALANYLANDSAMKYYPGGTSLNHVGDPPEVHRQMAFFNAGYDLDGLQFYSFGNYGKKTAQSIETYRRPSQDGGYTDPTTGEVTHKYAYGFNPYEASDEVDMSLAGGVKGDLAGWSWDAAAVYGKDYMDVYTLNSMNFTLWQETGASPSSFFDGRYKASQTTGTLDVSKNFSVGMAEPLTLAMGGEWRRDTYGIEPGEAASYYGSGASSFPGYNPAVNTGDYQRHSYAGYVDVILQPIEPWQIDIAGRYEHYSDFGSKTVGKLTTRYDFSPAFAIRGTASTGFRAPTLGEEYYSAVNVGPTSANPQLQPNSSGAASLGFGGGLKPELSTNFSLGLVLHPIERMTSTLDFYQIKIKDRVEIGSFAYSTGCVDDPTSPCPADTNGDGVNDSDYNQALGLALVQMGYLGGIDPATEGGSLDSTARANISVSLFNNALTTRTRGVDFVTTYSTLPSWGVIDWTAAANYNKNKVLHADSAPAALGGAVMFSDVTQKNLETDSPKYRFNLGMLTTIGKFSVNLKERIYGPQSTLQSVSSFPDSVVSQLKTYEGGNYYKRKIGVLALTDIEFSYKPITNLSVSLGADNVFNQYPDKLPKPIWDYYVNSYSTNTSRAYINNSPIGYFGARYYGKLTYTF